MPSTPMPITISSFGYLHGPAPVADHVVDVRDMLRDPARAQAILDLDGRDPRVRLVVLATPGAVALVVELLQRVLALAPERPRLIAIGCAGGRHRSVALAETLAGMLIAMCQPVVVEHRDVHRPRVIRGGESR